MHFDKSLNTKCQESMKTGNEAADDVMHTNPANILTGRYREQKVGLVNRY